MKREIIIDLIKNSYSVILLSRKNFYDLFYPHSIFIILNKETFEQKYHPLREILCYLHLFSVDFHFNFILCFSHEWEVLGVVGV